MPWLCFLSLWLELSLLTLCSHDSGYLNWALQFCALLWTHLWSRLHFCFFSDLHSSLCHLVSSTLYLKGNHRLNFSWNGIHLSQCSSSSLFYKVPFIRDSLLPSCFVKVLLLWIACSFYCLCSPMALSSFLFVDCLSFWVLWLVCLATSQILPLWSCFPWVWFLSKHQSQLHLLELKYLCLIQSDRYLSLGYAFCKDLFWWTREPLMKLVGLLIEVDGRLLICLFRFWSIYFAVLNQSLIHYLVGSNFQRD